MTRTQLFIAFILFGLASGSGFFVGHTLLKPSYVLPMMGVFCLPWDLAKNRLRYDRLALWIVLYIGLASFYNLPDLGKDQLIDLAYVFSTFLVYIAAILSAVLISRGDQFPAKAVLALFGLLIVLYFYQFSTGSYFLPTPDEDGIYSTTFNNANDLNSFIVAFMPLVLYSLRQLKASKLVITLAFVLLAGWVFLLGSRFCILALFVVPLMFALFSASYLWKLIAFCFSGLLAVVLGQLDWGRLLKAMANFENPVISRSADRLYLFLFELENDKSSSYRVDSYVYAFNHMSDAIFGVGTKNYETFYQSGFGEGTLVAIAPHSYFIENMIAFGWLGLFLIVAMLTYCLFKVVNDSEHLFYSLTSLMLFLMVSFVPSTVIRLPILWFPLFFFTYLACQHRINFDWDHLLEASTDQSLGDQSNIYEPAAEPTTIRSAYQRRY